MNLFAVIVTAGLLVQTTAPPAEIPVTVLDVAQDYLDKFVEGVKREAAESKRVFDPDACPDDDIDKCQLGEPYRWYSMGDEELAAYVAGDHGLMTYVRDPMFVVPVENSGGRLMNIMVVRNLNEHGKPFEENSNDYILLGVYYPNGCEEEDEVVYLRRRLPASAGYRIHRLRMFNVGEFLVACRSDGQLLLSPLDRSSATAIGANYRSDPLVPLNHAEPLLRAKAEAYLARMANRSN